MIAGLVQILLFQGLGEVVARFFLPLIPGPVIGLVLLLAWLRLRGGVPATVDLVATAFSQNLGLLFIPAAVGVVMFTTSPAVRMANRRQNDTARADGPRVTFQP